MRPSRSILPLTLLLWIGTAAIAWAQSPLRCDVNGDRVVNHIDIRTIMASVNRPATRGDPRDADGDGKITLGDVRSCMQVCTRDSCNGLNAVPVAHAGPDQTAPVGAMISLNGAQSTDSDGPQPLSYAWTMVERPGGSSAALSNASTVGPGFVIDRPGRYVMSLVVNDGFASSPADLVIVSTSNSPPVANGGPDRSVFVGDWVILNSGASTDVDGDILSFTWTLRSKPAGSAAALQFVRPRNDDAVVLLVDKEGTYAVELVASDGKSTSAPDTILITTGNTMPVANPKASCAALENVDCSVPIGTAVSVDGSASTDVDGDPLTYSWAMLSRPAASSAAVSPATGVSTGFASDAPGAFVVQLIVNDGKVNSAAKTVTVTSTNVKPTAVATINPISIVALPQAVQLDGSASIDPEGQGLTYLWSLLAKPAGSGAALSSTTAQKPTFSADLVGTYTAQLIVNDGFLSSTPVTVSASTVNQPPTASAGPDQTVVAGSTVQLTGAGSSDPEGAGLGYFWSILNKPAGSTADFNNANAVNPTFPADRKGTFVAQLIVNDGTLDSAPDTVQITATNRSPVAAADSYSVAQDGSLVIGAAAGVLGNDTDADGDTLAAILVGANPTGLALNSNGGFTYTPPAGFSGTTTFQYKSNDGTVDSNTVTVTIDVTAIALPVVTVSATTPNASETGPVHGQFTFTRTGSTAADLNVFFAMTGTAVNGGDYTIPSFVTIAAGQSSATVALTVLLDPIIESSETAIATIIASPTNFQIGAQGSATVTIADGVPNVVSVVASHPNAGESGPVHGEFTVTRTGPTTFALNVFFAMTGTAVNGGDYTIPSFVTIAAGQSSATAALTVLLDPIIESSETAIATIIASPTNFQIGAQGSATVTIADGVPNVVSVVASQPNAGESGPVHGEFTVTRTGPTTFALNVFFAMTGTAVNGGDYTIPSFVTIAAGQTSATAALTVLLDPIIESSETAIATIVASPTNFQIGAQGSATVTIADGVPNVVSVVASQANASESGPVHGEFTVTRTGPTTFALNVFFAMSGTAVNGGDYTIPSFVTIAAGQSSATAALTVLLDPIIESSETAIATIVASPTNFQIGAQGSATVTIADGVPNVVSVVASQPNAGESGPVHGEFTVTRTGPTTFALNVFFAMSGTAVNGGDYTIPSFVTIPVGQASATAPVTVLADALSEGSETVILTIVASPTTLQIGAQGSATVTIADDAAIVQVTVTAPNASEAGPTNGTFTLTRSGGNIGAALNVFSGFTGSASNGGDYASIGTPQVFAPGQTSLTVTVAVLADNVTEGNETVVLTLQPNAAYTIGASGSATVTIADEAVIVQVTATAPNASEVGPTNGTFTLTRSGGNLGAALNVFSGFTGSASNGADYASIGTPQVFAPGQTSLTVTVAALADNVTEGNETVVLTIMPNVAYTIGASSTATITIADDPVIVQVTATAPNASESGSTDGTFTLTRSGGNIGATLNVYSGFTGSAGNGADYSSIGTPQVFAPGQTSLIVSVVPIPDGVAEGPETIILTILANVAYMIGASGSATVTIVD